MPWAHLPSLEGRPGGHLGEDLALGAIRHAPPTERPGYLAEVFTEEEAIDYNDSVGYDSVDRASPPKRRRHPLGLLHRVCDGPAHEPVATSSR